MIVRDRHGQTTDAIIADLSAEAFAAQTGITQMVRFKGVASKYLLSNLGWRRMIVRDGDRLTLRHWLAGAIT